MFRKLGTEDGLLKTANSVTVDSFDLGKYVTLQVVNSGIREPIEQLTPVKLETVFDGFVDQPGPDFAFVLKTSCSVYCLDFQRHVHEQLVFKGSCI